MGALASLPFTLISCSTNVAGDGAAVSTTEPAESTDTVQVVIGIYNPQVYTDLGAGACEGRPPFEALHSNNVAYLIGASKPGGSGALSTGFTVSELVDGENGTGCETRIEFLTEVSPDRHGYYVQVGNPSQWRAGPVHPPNGNRGHIWLAACQGVDCP